MAELRGDRKALAVRRAKAWVAPGVPLRERRKLIAAHATHGLLSDGRPVAKYAANDLYRSLSARGVNKRRNCKIVNKSNGSKHLPTFVKDCIQQVYSYDPRHSNVPLNRPEIDG